MTAKHLTSETFEREVLRSDRPALVDFYADWCGQCRAMERVLDELADEIQHSASVAKINVDAAPELAREYGVQSIPTFVVVRNGEATTKLVGVQSKQALAAALAG